MPELACVIRDFLAVVGLIALVGSAVTVVLCEIRRDPWEEDEI